MKLHSLFYTYTVDMFLFLQVFSLPVVFAVTTTIIIIVIVVIDSHFRTTVTQSFMCSRTHRTA